MVNLVSLLFSSKNFKSASDVVYTYFEIIVGSKIIYDGSLENIWITIKNESPSCTISTITSALSLQHLKYHIANFEENKNFLNMKFILFYNKDINFICLLGVWKWQKNIWLKKRLWWYKSRQIIVIKYMRNIMFLDVMVATIEVFQGIVIRKVMAVQDQNKENR